jgi:hypothetical protein
VDIQIDLKNKEKFSFTRKQLMFYGFFLNIIYYRFDLMNFNVRINIILLLLLNYILIKADPFVGMVSYLGCIIFNLQHSNNAEILFSLIPLIFIFKQVNQNKYLGAMIYLATNLFFIVYLNARDYLIERLSNKTLPRKLLSFITKKSTNSKNNYLSSR